MSGISGGELGKGTKSHLNKYIGLADQKASLLLTGQLAFLGLTATTLNELVSVDGGLSELFVVLTVVSGVAAILLSISVVYPRTPKAKKGVIFWENIIQYDSPDEFEAAFVDLDDSERLNRIVVQNYYLAKVASKKYCYLRWALRATIAMILFSVGTLVSLSIM
jgi:hypothetical protein